MGDAVRDAGLVLGCVSSTAQSLAFAHLGQVLSTAASPAERFAAGVWVFSPGPGSLASPSFPRSCGSSRVTGAAPIPWTRLCFPLTWTERAGPRTRYSADNCTGLKAAGSWSGESSKNQTKVRTFLQSLMTKCFCYGSFFFSQLWDLGLFSFAFRVSPACQ